MIVIVHNGEKYAAPDTAETTRVVFMPSGQMFRIAPNLGGKTWSVIQEIYNVPHAALIAE